MTTEQHLFELKTEELRTIIRSLRLKTSIKGYSKMRHETLVAELSKLLTVEPDGDELVVNVKQLAPVDTSLRITLNKQSISTKSITQSKQPEKETPAFVNVEVPKADTASSVNTKAKKPRAKVAPQHVPMNNSSSCSSSQDVSTSATVFVKNDYADDSDEATSSTSVGKRVKAPPSSSSNAKKKAQTESSKAQTESSKAQTESSKAQTVKKQPTTE